MSDKYEDPFDSEIKEDPSVEDHFSGRSQSLSRSEHLPDATAILVLGILSILGAFCYGVVGLILGIIGIALAGKPERLYKEHPKKYTLTSYNNMKAGKICAIIGLCISVIMSLFFLLVILRMSEEPWYY